MKRLGIGLAALALAEPAAAQIAKPSPELAAWWRGYEAAPSVKTPDGRKLRVFCQGSGGPVAVFESGLGDGAWGWRPVQPAIARQTRVCSYDRAGLGGSDPAKGPRDIDAMAADLAVVVKAVGRGKPVLLISHSLGGPIVRQYAYRHPDQVAGLVLVDPSADHQNERFRAVLPDFDKINRINYAPLQHCLAAVEKGPIAESAPDYRLCISKPPPDMPADLAHNHVAYNQSPAHYREVLAELDAQTGAEDLNAREADAARRPLGDKPLLVLTAGETPKMPGETPEQLKRFDMAWYEMHNEIAALSTRGRQRIVPGASHYIQGLKPQAVVDAVAEVLTEVRDR
jgi:pimeloyl-ACP methyl ester carboxylesterase